MSSIFSTVTYYINKEKKYFSIDIIFKLDKTKYRDVMD